MAASRRSCSNSAARHATESLLRHLALTKILLLEEGEEEARATWERAGAVVAARIGYVEARAAIAAARRSRRLSRAGYEKARARLESRWSELAAIELDAPLAESAAEIAERHGLRTNDAIHLAAALAVRARLLLTWDRELRRAALEAGLAVAPYG